MRERKRGFLRFVATLHALLLVAMVLHVAPAVADERPWQYQGKLYLWGAGISGKTVAGDDFDASFTDLLSDLDFAFMGQFEAKRDKWGFLADVIVLDLSFSETMTGNIINRPVSLNVNSNIESWIVSGAVTYAFAETETSRFEALGGVRYLDLDVRMNFAPGTPVERQIRESGGDTNAFVGVRGNTRLNDRWLLNYYADIGTGDSDVTWQALLGATYQFESVDLGFGYRHLAWEFDDRDLLAEMEVSGPYVGIIAHF